MDFSYLLAIFSIHNVLYTIPLGVQGYALSWVEFIGVITGLICIWLASRESSSNFFFGLINVTLFAIIFFQINLYANFFLQLAFFIANVYGWYAWCCHTEDQKPRLRIHWMTPGQACWVALFCVVAISGVAIYIDPLFQQFTKITVWLFSLCHIVLPMPTLQPDPMPWWDSAVCVLSLVAMVMMARKLVENWILWLMVNAISVKLYMQQGIQVMALQYIVLMFIALHALRLWVVAARKIQYPP